MSDAAFWDKVAAKYAKDPIGDMEAYTLTLDRMVEILQPHHRVLELGCGTGSTALEVAGGVDRYIATDVSPAMIAIAQAKQTAETPAQLTFSVHDVGQMLPGTHDVVLALNLLHLVPDLEDVLEDIYDALPKGGLLIAKTALLRDGLWVLPWIIPVMRAIGKAPYVRTLAAPDLLGMMRDAGFVVTEQLLQTGTVPRMFTVASKP